MSTWFQLMKREWERTLLAIAVVLLLVYLAVWALGLRERPGGGVVREARRGANVLMNYDTAFAFLDPRETLALGAGGPFHFLLELKTPKVEPPRVIIQPPPPVPPPVPTPLPPHAAPHAAGGKAHSDIRVFGVYGDPFGAKIALLKDIKRQQTLFLRQGEDVDGFKVKTFSEAEIEIQTPAEETVTIPFAEQKVFTLE